MARTFGSRSALTALLVAIGGCGSDITTPGRCPELCPQGSIQLADTLLTSPVVSDTSVRGYVLVREASYLLVSNLDSLKSEVLLQFSALPTKWTVGTDSATLGVVDSVQLSLSFVQRDTAAKALQVVVHRLPAQFDTGATYATIQPYFADSTLWDTTAVGAISDTLVSGNVALAMPDTLRPLAGDSGIISLGVSLVSPAPTALAVGSGYQSITQAPILYFYVRGHLISDTLQKDTLSKVLSLQPLFATFVMSPDPGQPVSGVLAVGGIPTARATLRLALPKEVVDSNSIVRGTLILTTSDSVGGFARDSFMLAAQPLLRDNGPKSLLFPDSSVAGTTWLHPGQTGQVQLDITRLLRLWGTTTGDSLPRTLVLRVVPEGRLLSAVNFRGVEAGANAAQLRVTYVRRYSFGVP
jgi:hypothetical protein